MQKSLAFALLVSMAAGASAQTNWQRAPLPFPLPNRSTPSILERFTSFVADPVGLANQLSRVPMEESGRLGEVLWLPHPSGDLRRFRVVESPIQTPNVEEQTGVKTYAAQGIDDPYATARLDLGPNGFHGFVLSPDGTYYIDPVELGDQRRHRVYYKRWAQRTVGFACDVVPEKSSADPFGGGIVALRPGPNRKEYRLALKGTFEYTTFYGGVTQADNGSVTVMNRVNGVYERDLSIRMNIVNLVNYGTSADPYTNNNGSTMLGQNQTTCDANPGNANYDIGHVFSTGGGGIAGLRVVGVTGSKARGVTGLPSPTGDPFAIDYVAHEMGHQYGSNHTFNGTTSSCGGGNRSAANAYEPGSGSTIMAYAGICGSENLQNFSDDYFHTRSQDVIEAWRNNASSGGTTISTGNNSPVVNSGGNFTIPRDTPFRLTGSATDQDGDALTYCWEQFNLGTATPTSDESTRPLFRSYSPTTSPTRFFPRQATVLANSSDVFENLPSVDRSMLFRLTARDNRSGGGNWDWAEATITVSGDPFAVSAPNTSVSWQGLSSQTVTWTVGGGSVASNVRILLSTNGGASYYNGTATVLEASTPNDGSHTITVPNVNTTQARIFVEAVGNVFYDVSNVNFTITPVTTQVVAPASFTVIDGSLISGVVSALAASDDVKVQVQASPSLYVSRVEFNGTTGIANPGRVSFILESSTNLAGRRRSIRLFNYTTSAWEDVSTTSIPLTDGTVQVNVTTNASRFVQAGTGAIRAQVLNDFPAASRTLPRAVESIDRAVWEIQS